MTFVSASWVIVDVISHEDGVDDKGSTKNLFCLGIIRN